MKAQVKNILHPLKTISGFLTWEGTPPRGEVARPE